MFTCARPSGRNVITRCIIRARAHGTPLTTQPSRYRPRRYVYNTCTMRYARSTCINKMNKYNLSYVICIRSALQSSPACTIN